MTTYTYDVGTGGDYSTLALCRAAWQGIVTDNDRVEVTLLDSTAAGDEVVNLPSGFTYRIAAASPYNGTAGTGTRITSTLTFFASSVGAVNYEVHGLVGDGDDYGGYNQPFRVYSGTNGVTATYSNVNILDGKSNWRGIRAFSNGGSLTCNIENSVFAGGLTEAVRIDANTAATMTVNLRASTFYQSRCMVYRSSSTTLTLNVDGCTLDPDTSSWLWFSGTGGTVNAYAEECAFTESSPANWTSTTNCVTSATPVTGTPASGQIGYTDISADDFSLVDHANNVAIGLASTVSMPSTDVTGLSRPQGTYSDAGAFEVEVPAGTTVTPGAGSLTTATFAPSVTFTAHVWAAPSLATLTTTPAAPTVTATDNKWAAPAATTLTTTPATPTVTATDNKWATPAATTLTLTTFAPSVAFDADLWVTPGAGTLTIGVFAPTVLSTYEAAPGPGALEISTYAPTVAFTGAPTSVVTYGVPLTDVVLVPGDEWFVTLEGPAADQPFARVTLTFNEHV